MTLQELDPAAVKETFTVLHERVAGQEVNERLRPHGVLFTRRPLQFIGGLAWNLTMQRHRYDTELVIIESPHSISMGCGEHPEAVIEVRRLVCNLTTDTVYTRRDDFCEQPPHSGAIGRLLGNEHTAHHALTTMGEAFLGSSVARADEFVDLLLMQGQVAPALAPERPIPLEDVELGQRIDTSLLIVAEQMAC